ncbi:hypothetical protein ETAE_0048 [Edwardsiella piscicida]|uniref:Uncharacterized protein n=1 Tax=Edwardsiella piscicida TaxID=1263550 RepID=A0AAU8PB97_EDWPI|nr:hypothetical protein ETAE_0048 [Edwardsiella tarda EIB202]
MNSHILFHDELRLLMTDIWHRVMHIYGENGRLLYGNIF